MKNTAHIDVSEYLCEYEKGAEIWNVMNYSI